MSESQREDSSARHSIPYILGSIKQSVDELKRNTARIEDLLLGDGQPGVIDRLAKIEEGFKRFDRISADQKEQSIKLISMDTAVKLHTENDLKHSWKAWFSGKTIAALLTCFVVLYEILENIPEAWQFLSKLLGG